MLCRGSFNTVDSHRLNFWADPLLLWTPNAAIDSDDPDTMSAMWSHSDLISVAVICSFPLSFAFADISSVCSQASSDWLSSLKNILEGGGVRQAGTEGRITDSSLPPATPRLPFTRLGGFMRLISDNLVVTRHCTQPLLIFDEGSGPSAAAFWAFNGRVFRWHSCAVTFQALLKNDLRSKSFYSLSVSFLCLQCSLNSREEGGVSIKRKSNYTCTVQTRWGDYLK